MSKMYGLSGQFRVFWLGFALLAVLMAQLPVARAGSIYPLITSDPDRKAVLNALRPAVEASMNGPVRFLVHTISSYERRWAFVVADPQRPGGHRIDPKKTRFRHDIEFMDGLTVFALLRFADGRWNLIDHHVGPTDVSYAAWPSQYGVPAALLGLSAEANQ